MQNIDHIIAYMNSFNTLFSDNIGKTISKNRKKLHISQTELAEELTRRGYETTNKAVSKWENNINEPGIYVFFEICDILKINTNKVNSNSDNNIINVYSKLNNLGKSRVDEYADLLSHSPLYVASPDNSSDMSTSFTIGDETINTTIKKTIPFLLMPVSAGTGNFLDDEAYEDMPYDDDDNVPTNADFALRVSGDSMEPLLHRNQIIYIHKQDFLDNNEIGIFFLDNEAYVKKLQIIDDHAFLISLNNAYAPIPITEDSNFKIFGKFVG